MATLVYQFPVRTLGTAAARRDILCHPLIVEQIHLAHQLRNVLVAVELDHEKALRALWSEDHAVATAEEAMTQAEQQLQLLFEQAKKEHQDDRSTATRPDTSRKIATIRGHVKEARAARKAALTAARPSMKPREHELDVKRKEAIKATYADFVQTRGLHWASYNAVKAHHQTAVTSVIAARKAGRVAQLRFKRWDGTGTITVQLQRMHGGDCRCSNCAEKQTRAIRKDNPNAAAVLPDPNYPPTDPPRTPRLLASGEGKWRNVLQIGGWMDPDEWQQLPLSKRRQAGRTNALWSFGLGRQITLPVGIRKMMPADADITMAQLTRRRIAGQFNLMLNVTATVPDPTPSDGPPIAVHMGWRQRSDGSIRVATWASSQPLHVDERVRDVILIHGDGRSGEIIVPASWLEELARCDEIRAQRDKNQAPVQEQLAAWLDEHPQPDPTPDEPDRMLTGAQVRQWRSPNRLASIAIRWQQQQPTEPGGVDMAIHLETWRKQDKHLWEWEYNLRDQLIRRRTDGWRRAAAQLSSQVGAVIVDATDLAALRRRSDVADDDPVLPGKLAQAARARASFASPGSLRATITAAANRRGVAEITVPAQHLTRTHRRCGHVADPHPRYAASTTVMCPNCGDMYDQDFNAAQLMLQRAQDGQPG